jgi:site-specific recombinase XerC
VWLQVWADLGRAPRTIDAYARGLTEYLLLCERDDVDPVTANRARIAIYVRELTSRPHRLGANVVAIGSGSGLANATIQQRLVPVRLFYDFLIEEGLRESNPVGRGRYTPRTPGGRPPARPGAAADQVAVDPQRTAVGQLLQCLALCAIPDHRERALRRHDHPWFDQR